MTVDVLLWCQLKNQRREYKHSTPGHQMEARKYSVGGNQFRPSLLLWVQFDLSVFDLPSNLNGSDSKSQTVLQADSSN